MIYGLAKHEKALWFRVRVLLRLLRFFQHSDGLLVQATAFLLSAVPEAPEKSPECLLCEGCHDRLIIVAMRLQRDGFSWIPRP